MLHTETLTFLRQLKKNNTREWFTGHKDDYEAARADVEELVGELILTIGKFDASVKGLVPRDTLFRIYRDVRFSKDKTPYKTHFGAVIGEGGRKCDGTFCYLHVEPGNSFVASGIHGPTGPQLARVRRAIAQDGAALRTIITSAPFRKTFGELSGDQLTSAPRGYERDHPEIDLLRYKDFMGVHHFSDAQMASPRFVAVATAVFKQGKPLNDWLNWALAE